MSEENKNNAPTDEELREQETALQQKREQKAGLLKAMEEEEEEISKIEEELRVKRERAQSLRRDRADMGDDKEKNKSDSESVAEEAARLVLASSRKQNLESAMRQFYKTKWGKKYDPVTDVSGRLREEFMREHLRLTDNDISVEQISRKLIGAAMSHSQDDVESTIVQHEENVANAKGALDDKGSGARSYGNQRGEDNKPDQPTNEDIANAARIGIPIDKYMAAKKKLPSVAAI